MTQELTSSMGSALFFCLFGEVLRCDVTIYIDT